MRGDCSPVFARDAKCHDAYGETHIASFQFNFTVRKRVAREDGDEHLFDWHTVVVRCDGKVDEDLAALAAKEYSLTGYEPTLAVSAALDSLTSAELEKALVSARAYLEQRTRLWDWDEEVDLIGVARVVFVPATP